MSDVNNRVNKSVWWLCVWSFVILLVLGSSLTVVAQPNRAPDLIVERVVFDPVEPEPGVGVEFKATITNRGRERVVANFNVYFEIDNTFLTSRVVSSHLDPGKQVEVQTLWTAVEGEHLLRVRVDVFDEVPESDEANNKYETRLEVRKPEGIRSITLDLLANVSQGLQKTGQAIQIQPADDIFQLLNTFQVALGLARQELITSADKISIAKQTLSPNLAAEVQVQASDQVAALYRSLASAFDVAIQGIQRLNPQLLTESFEQVRAHLVGLSALSIEGISLESVSEAIPLMDQGLEKAEQLEAALGGAKDIDVNAVARDLVALLAQIGAILTRVGADVMQTSQGRSANFSDSKGQSIVRYQVGQELKITASHAQHLQWEVFDRDGQAVFIGEAQADQFIWHGTSSDGKALSAGRYFYRLTITTSASSWIELGQIVLSP